MVLGKETSVAGRDIEAGVDKDEVLTGKKSAFISKKGWPYKRGSSVTGKKTAPVVAAEGTAVPDGRAVPDQQDVINENTVTNKSKTVPTKKLSADETTTSAAATEKDKKVTDKRKTPADTENKTAAEKKASNVNEKAAASDGEGTTTTTTTKDTTATRKKSVLGRGLMPGRGSMKGKGAKQAKVPALSKCREVTKVKAEEVKVIVESPDGRNPTITIKGRIEEGDGLFEERMSSGSDDDQATSLIRPEEPLEADSESSLAILTQVMLPFLVAGLGMVGAGLVLDLVQHWAVFKDLSELFIMVPALLGLKGNLEMTLASRLSTHANLGHLDNRENCLSMIVGNMALIQCQAIVVGFLASVAAVVMGWIPEGHFDLLHALLLCAAALVTASLASLILSMIMVGVILASRKCRINPDNVATPIAASLGDLTTLGLLAWIASVLYSAKGTDVWVTPLVVVGYLLSLPLWVWLASRNKHTKEVLYSGWTPVISAMMISSMGGLILDFTVSSYKGIAVFQPVINGVGGNLVAVQASRISTALHAAAPLGKLPKFAAELCINPCSAYCARVGHPRTARVLLLLVVPGHLVFMYTISYLKAGHTSLTPIFVVTYLLAAFLQVAILLYVAHVMVHWMWKTSIDPDNSAIPYLTALGDLLGTGLLAIAFHFLYIVGDGDSDLGD